jgi:aspartyl-tRNA(Asn)/glutamyl-tRNA(Gln) amidotransferase subunit C
MFVRNTLKLNILKSKIVDLSNFKPNWSIEKTMMNNEDTEISTEEMKKLSFLSRIELDEYEMKLFQKDIKQIVNWFNIIKNIETEGIEPLYSPQFELNSLNNARDDLEVTEGNIHRENLALTNLKKGNFYKVPKIIQED